LIIEPLQRFGTIRLGITPYPECEQCNNINGEDVTIPQTFIAEPTQTYTLVKKGVIYPDSMYEGNGSGYITNPDETTKKLYLTLPNNSYPKPSEKTGEPTWDQIVLDPTKYYIRLNGIGLGETLNIFPYTDFSNNPSDANIYYYTSNTVYDYNNPSNNNKGVSYELFDVTQIPLNSPLSNISTVNGESLPTGCGQYMTLYNEYYAKETYCVNGFNTNYDDLKNINRTIGFSCGGGKNPAGQVIYNSKGNGCKTCETWSGYSEIRNGLFRIIPAADTSNWEANIAAIDEYCRRKLVGKLFCEGLVNYSFLDNWLSGSLYFFPFKSRIRWDDEQNLDISDYSTSYCEDLVYFKTGTKENPDKRFYYRSSWFNPVTNKFASARGTLAHPTTLVDLGPRDEFIKEICIDPNLDPNCSVVRNIGATSYQDIRGILGLYINYKLDVASPSVTGDIYTFFRNTGFNSRLPLKMRGQVLNGDILQLMSMNSEAGIDGFDLESKKYEMYNPIVLDPDVYTEFFKDDSGALNGPLPVQLKLDETDGYRVRACLNEPGRLTESSQVVPFYLWNKNGTGFGAGVNQAWYYPIPGNEDTIQAQPLQGMTYYYKYSGDTTHPYLLLPMTKQYSGDIISLNAIVNPLNSSTFDEIFFNYDEYGSLTITVDNNNGPHTNYNRQEEGFTFLYITGGDNTVSGATTGKLYTRIGNGSGTDTSGNWDVKDWTNTIDYILSPTTSNYSENQQILSTPYLYYFGLKPGKTAIDKFIKRFGPLGAFPSAE
jgi:hypothetical protein